jgi:hypothetical protein
MEKGPAVGDRTLQACSDAALDESENSLEFFKNRLSSVKFALLEQEIGTEGVFAVLRLFGVGSMLAHRSYDKGCNHVTGKCTYYKSGFCAGDPCGLIA